MAQRRWRAREVVAMLLVASMTSSACSSGCRSSAPANQATGEAAGRTGASPDVRAAAADAASVAVPALDAAATNEALTYIEQTAQQSASAVPDLATQSAALGRDPAKVFAFVRNDIRYQVYDGVLRGAAGALSGRAANAWDTALLVAELLRRGGFDVRFARGTLPDAAAAALVGRMFDQAMQPARQTLSTGGLQPPPAAAGVAGAVRARIEANWTTNTAEIMAALKKAGIPLGTAPPVSDATLLAEARDHVWVEYKDGIQWVPVDPVAATKIGEAAAPERETFDAIPESRQHVVTFTLNVEQRASGNVETRPAMTLRAPAADLHGQPILLAHQVDVTGSGAWKATPVLLVGDKAVGGTAYGAGGVETPDDSGAGGIGSRLSQMFGGTPTAAAELTAVWFDVTMTSPDGRAETARREVLDRIGPVARAARSEATAPLRPVAVAVGRPTALTAVMACAVTAGPLNAAALTGRVAAAAPVLRDEALRARLAKGDTKDIADDRLRQIGITTSAALAVLPQSAHLVSQQYAAEAAPALGQPILLYEASPRLAVATFSRTAGDEPSSAASVSIDLRRNTLRAVGRGGAPAFVIAANIARGALDGAIEDALLAGGAATASTASLLAEARLQGVAIAASTASAFPADHWPEAARVRIRAEQASSVAVVAPQTPVVIGGEPRTVWWRIDTTTGETVGVLDSGLHGAQTEYAALGYVIIFAIGPNLLLLGASAATRIALVAYILLPQGGNAAQRGWNAARRF